MACPFSKILDSLKRIKVLILILITTWAIASRFVDIPTPFEYIGRHSSRMRAHGTIVKDRLHRKLIMSRNEGETLAEEDFPDPRIANEASDFQRTRDEENLNGNENPMLAGVGHHENLEAKITIAQPKPCTNVHAFYYPWYSNPKVDGRYTHWNHKVLPHWDKEVDKMYKKTSHEPPNDVASDFYPELGAYSSRDPVIINEHFKQLAIARIGVIAVSYYPSGTADENGKPWDDIYLLLLDKAAESNMKVTFHIEPYKGRNANTVRNDIVHIINTYGSHKGFYRYNVSPFRKVPLFYVYDSYLTKKEDWAAVLQASGPNTIRGTKYDSMVIGLLVDVSHSSYTSIGGFDGLYTYFASSGFTYGSRWDNWREISARSHEMNFMFIPSVGPGYIDTNIRPWNSENTRARLAGGYYKSSWGSALEVRPKIVSITSFNEWHEGTQIEKAKPKLSNSRKYLDYAPFGSDYYLKLTREFVDSYQECI